LQDIATCALFLAAKVEEDPRKLEHVIRVSHACVNKDKPHLDTQNETYKKAAENLVVNELLMLQTLGFEVSVDHPHSHVVKGTQIMNLSKDLAQTAYFMATNRLAVYSSTDHLTCTCLL
jgi:cyclin T